MQPDVSFSPTQRPQPVSAPTLHTCARSRKKDVGGSSATRSRCSVLSLIDVWWVSRSPTRWERFHGSSRRRFCFAVERDRDDPRAEPDAQRRGRIDVVVGLIEVDSRRAPSSTKHCLFNTLKLTQIIGFSLPFPNLEMYSPQKRHAFLSLRYNPPTKVTQRKMSQMQSKYVDSSRCKKWESHSGSDDV